ncbi:MAG: glycoside hydrolase family 9 protein [Sporocytophaga sp.]|nr:glycoside hydrolase family 9 protein [Sporocytophaga sp.]
MTQKNLISLILFICFLCNNATAQTKGYRLDFNSNDWTPSYSHPNFTVKNKDGILNINAQAVGSDYENFVGYFPKTDLSANPFVYVKIKTQYPVDFELRLLDKANKETNDDNPKIAVLPAAEYKWITFDYTNKFKQSWPTNDTVNSREIVKLAIILNGGGPDFTGWINIDEIIFGDSNLVKLPYDPIVYQPKVNQAGYFIKAPKIAIIPSDKTLNFQIIEKTTKTPVFSGTTSASSKWQYSEESVVKADFSELEQEGHYYLLAKGLKASYDFAISDTILNGLFSFFKKGRNPLNYCFVTGFGTQSPQHIHHRISSADGVIEPVPGLIVNGPHNDDLSFCTYPTTIPAFTYLDDECSAPTNEVAININSALVYSLNALKSIYSENILSPVKKKTSEEKIALYPNPNDGTFEIAVPEIFKNGQWKLLNTNGNQMAQGVLSSGAKQEISVHGIHAGIYLLIFDKGENQRRMKVNIY